MSIPNILSIFRIVLVPFFVYEFTFCDNFSAAGIILAVSGLTDCLDGFIARKFNMITDLGKILDPIADKLTQIMAVFCLAHKRIAIMWFLFAFLVIKDFVLLVGGITLYKKKDMVVASNWYGKIATIVFYVSMILIILFYSVMPEIYKNLIALCIIIVCFFALCGYISYFFSVRSKKNE